MNLFGESANCITTDFVVDYNDNKFGLSAPKVEM